MNVYRHKDPVRTFQLNEVLCCDLVVTGNWLVNADQFGIPPEIVHKYYNDCEPLQVNYEPVSDKVVEVLYVSVFDHMDELQYLLQVISLFNEIPSVTLTVYCSQEHYEIVQNFSNEHIKYEIKRQELVALSANVVITYGPLVLHFIKQAIPVIVMGPYGFGGLITPENLPWLVKNSFLGRPGGTAGEPVPYMLLVQQLLQCKKCINMADVMALNKNLAEQIPCRPLSDIDEVIDNARGVYKKLNDPGLRWSMVPGIASNIVFTEKKEQVFLKRKMINDTVGVISKADKAFFDRIDGETDCATLYTFSGMCETDFWETILSLKNRKILLF